MHQSNNITLQFELQQQIPHSLKNMEFYYQLTCEEQLIKVGESISNKRTMSEINERVKYYTINFYTTTLNQTISIQFCLTKISYHIFIQSNIWLIHVSINMKTYVSPIYLHQVYFIYHHHMTQKPIFTHMHTHDNRFMSLHQGNSSILTTNSKAIVDNRLQTGDVLLFNLFWCQLQYS